MGHGWRLREPQRRSRHICGAYVIRFTSVIGFLRRMANLRESSMSMRSFAVLFVRGISGTMRLCRTTARGIWREAWLPSWRIFSECMGCIALRRTFNPATTTLKSWFSVLDFVSRDFPRDILRLLAAGAITNDGRWPSKTGGANRQG